MPDFFLITKKWFTKQFLHSSHYHTLFRETTVLIFMLFNRTETKFWNSAWKKKKKKEETGREGLLSYGNINISIFQKLLHLLNSWLYSWRQWCSLLGFFPLILISEYSIKICNYYLDCHDFGNFGTKSSIHVKRNEMSVFSFFFLFFFPVPALFC